MTQELAARVGQMMIFGWQDAAERGDSAGVNAQAAALIDDLRVGGVILMGRNVASPGRLRALTGELQQRAEARGLPPLFVTVDQEGGTVARLRPPAFRPTPQAADLGDAPAARDAARRIGEELREMGVNWNFAPVLDVNSNPANPVIGRRSYGGDAARVAALGAAAVRGYQEDAGVMACGKHFPGHGDTDVDSHLALPRIARSRGQLAAVELPPFAAAVAAGVAGIMSAHIVFTAMAEDAARPATLSRRVLTGLLREELGFGGLIVTDCLEMNGISDHWDLGEAAVQAVLAGADLMLCCHTWERQVRIHGGLMDAVATGRIPERRIDASLERIAAAKRRWIAERPAAPTRPAS